MDGTVIEERIRTLAFYLWEEEMHRDAGMADADKLAQPPGGDNHEHTT
ncbi:DUF2934 domain-containing protein [Paraburkholderia diazotrophica]|uniref:Uncharacterized protein n=1 Tax=Paraburkholderia diazotrophica TaxID=667676 RepID=A0A1H6WN11_9BURK|nr:DUF2934 domain-containing protein [Paraburkholderia diazotrophica]SEJ13862.1 hypothetical protein SAMN05192539_100728 [Paraburkholderia diazotrophica]